MLGISIIVCCYNSSKLIQKTLEYIALQKASCPWEVIVVNNNSTDNTTTVAQQTWDSLGCDAPFQIVDEPQAGLSYARKKGVEVSKYDYFIFCDDDNWLDENYVQCAYNIMQSNEKIGILGGKNIAFFEDKEPFWYKMMESTYAVGETNYPDGNITNTRGRVFGAGMVLNRTFWNDVQKHQLSTLLSDRKGKELSTGGDTELCWYARILTYEIHYASSLTLQHFMASGRLTWQYCRKLQRGIGQSLAYLGVYSYVWECIMEEKAIEPKKYWSKIFWSNLYFLTKSPKRLIRFFYKDIEGEFYFCNYEYAYGQLKELWKIRKEYGDIVINLYTDINALRKKKLS